VAWGRNYKLGFSKDKNNFRALLANQKYERSLVQSNIFDTTNLQCFMAQYRKPSNQEGTYDIVH